MKRLLALPLLALGSAALAQTPVRRTEGEEARALRSLARTAKGLRSVRVEVVDPALGERQADRVASAIVRTLSEAGLAATSRKRGDRTSPLRTDHGSDLIVLHFEARDLDRARVVDVRIEEDAVVERTGALAFSAVSFQTSFTFKDPTARKGALLYVARWFKDGWRAANEK